MRSIPLFVTGVFFDVLAGAAFGSGLGLVIAAGDVDGCDSGRNGFCGVSRGLVVLGGAGLLAIGGAFAGIGVPLTVAGAKSVPDERASLVPRVRVGGASGSLEWRF